MNPWIILILGVCIPIIPYGIITFFKNEYSCSTCGKSHPSQTTLMRCPTCNKMFCSDNLETVEEVSTTTQRNFEVSPSKKNPKFPCGTEFITMGKRVNIYCRKDSPHFGFRLKFDIKKRT